MALRHRWWLLLCIIGVSSGACLDDRSFHQHSIKAPASEEITDTSYYYHPATVQEHLPGPHEISLREKQQAVKDAFMFAWDGYRTFSWGSDENQPVTNGPVNTR